MFDTFLTHCLSLFGRFSANVRSFSLAHLHFPSSFFSFPFHFFCYFPFTFRSVAFTSRSLDLSPLPFVCSFWVPLLLLVFFFLPLRLLFFLFLAYTEISEHRGKTKENQRKSRRMEENRTGPLHHFRLHFYTTCCCLVVSL